MPRRVPTLLLLAVLSVAAARPPEPLSDAEKALDVAGVKSSDPASLVAFFRKRTPTPADASRIDALIEQLGDDTFAKRQEASKALAATGRIAVVPLQKALAHKDREVVKRAAAALRAIDPRPDTPVVLAAAKLLAKAKPADGPAALLDFLPYLEDESAEDELFAAALPLFAGSPPPALRSAAKHERRRSLAAYVLGREKKPADRDACAAMLKDESPLVRYRAAEALLASKDPRGMPPLIDLVGAGPMEIAGRAEGLLMPYAGEKAPAEYLDADAAQRKKCRDAWAAWYKAHGVKLDLAKFDPASGFMGLRMVVSLGGFGGNGAVWEYGPDKKQRWIVKDAGGPFDALPLPGNRLLIAEYNARKISERNIADGKILWTYSPASAPLDIQRLPNGNLLVTTNADITEVTRDGKATVVYKDVGSNIYYAERLANGHTVFGLYSGSVVELDAAGKEVNRFTTERVSGLTNIIVLPGSRYLVPLNNSNRIAEYDRRGTIVREIKVTQPTTIAPLPGGGFLVGSHTGNYVKEIDRNGKVLHEVKAEGQIFRVRTR